MRTIEQVKEQVQALLPAGWRASQCFFMSMSGANSPEMVDVRRIGWKEGVLATPIEQRAAWKKQWSLDTVAQAKAIETTLRSAGLKVVRDCGSLYVKIS